MPRFQSYCNWEQCRKPWVIQECFQDRRISMARSEFALFSLQWRSLLRILLSSQRMCVISAGFVDVIGMSEWLCEHEHGTSSIPAQCWDTWTQKFLRSLLNPHLLCGYTEYPFIQGCQSVPITKTNAKKPHHHTVPRKPKPIETEGYGKPPWLPDLHTLLMCLSLSLPHHFGLGQNFPPKNSVDGNYWWNFFAFPSKWQREQFLVWYRLLRVVSSLLLQRPRMLVRTSALLLSSCGRL